MKNYYTDYFDIIWNICIIRSN